MSAEHLRPLVAFVVVAIMGAAVLVQGLQTQPVLDVIRAATVDVVAGNPLLHEPLFVVEPGRRLAPDEQTEDGARGGSQAPAAASPAVGTTLGPSRDSSPVDPASDADAGPHRAGTTGTEDGRPAAQPVLAGAGGRERPDAGAGQKVDVAGAQAGTQQPGPTGPGRRDHDGRGDHGGDHGGDLGAGGHGEDRGQDGRGHRGDDRGNASHGEDRGHDRGDRGTAGHGEGRGHDRGDHGTGGHAGGPSRHDR